MAEIGSSSHRGLRAARTPLAASRSASNSFIMHVIHLAASGALIFVAEVFPSAVWAYAALAVFGSYSLGLLKNSPVTFLLFLPLLALRITEFISGAAIETGAYMTETVGYGHATGAFTRLLSVYILFFGVATLTVELLWPRLVHTFVIAPVRWGRQIRVIWYVLLGTMTLCSLYLVNVGLTNGFPLFNGYDRFAYLRNLDSPIYRGILLNRIVLVPFIGAMFAVPTYRYKSLLLLFWLLTVSIIFGEKFTSLLMIVSVFAMPPGLVHVARNKPIPLKAVSIILTALALITIPTVLIAYGATSNFDAALKRYGERVALQGQLWYRVDEQYSSRSRVDVEAFAADMGVWLHPEQQDPTKVGTRFGLYYVMEKFTPSLPLKWIMESGNGFVFSLYPYLILSLGISGMLVISSVLAFLHAWVMMNLAKSLARPSWLASLAFGRVMSSFYGTYNSGFLWNVFGIKTILTLMLGVLLLWVTRRLNVNRSRS